jgi:hypothetical protein
MDGTVILYQIYDVAGSRIFDGSVENTKMAYGHGTTENPELDGIHYAKEPATELNLIDLTNIYKEQHG